MKFDFVIGNPPYQEEKEGTSNNPIYHDFMSAAFEVGSSIELITPARFLFNAGKTPKDWNEKMLSDVHLKVLEYEQDSSKIFPTRDIKGGIAITYYDKNRKFGAIGAFSHFSEVRSILKKLQPALSKGNLSDIMILQNRFNLEVLYKDYPEYTNIISSDGKERRIVSSAFNKLSIFSDEKLSDEDVHILGLIGTNKRSYKWINKKYIEDNGNLYKWKVLVPKSNGSGALGEVLSTPLIGTPLIGTPLIGYTQSFIGIGMFDDQTEAEALLKYVKSKFARVALGILKITQDNPPEKWRCVPLQNFTNKSDIDWSKPIKDIDEQLYKKYKLSQEEINFIESKVKEMN